MEVSRIITIRDILMSKFSPTLMKYEYPYWVIEGHYSSNKDILQDLMDIFPDIAIEGFSHERIDILTYKFSVKFSFEEDLKNSDVFNFFNNQDDYEED